MTVFAFNTDETSREITVVIDRVWFGGSANTIHNAPKYIISDNKNFVFFNLGRGFDETQKQILSSMLVEYVSNPSQHDLKLRKDQDIFVLDVKNARVLFLEYDEEDKSVYWTDLKTNFFTTGIYSDTVKYLHHFDNHSIIEAIAKIDDLWNVDFGIDIFIVNGEEEKQLNHELRKRS
jgi:hypothetical protein